MEGSGWQVIRLLGKVLGATALISLVVLLIGYLLGWSDPFRFSNGFFAAGAILIILGILSITGGFSQRITIDMMQRYGSFISLLLTGVLLIGISVVIGSFL